MEDTILYADCFSGISGDMFLAALLDAGLPEQHLRDSLGTLNLGDYQLSVNSSDDQGSIQAVQVAITPSAHSHPHRNWRIIKQLIQKSNLSIGVQNRALSIFISLARAEAKIHGCPLEDVHFHEVGGVDSIIDIVGAAIGLEYFKIKRFTASSIPMPTGFVTCAHGILPLPAPAVCELLKDAPVYGIDLQQELVTPTGAAIIKGSHGEFGPLPVMQIKTIGYGAGTQQRIDKVPNLLRLIIGQQKTVEEAQRVTIIESNLDDWSPESFPYLSEKLLDLGALDVSLTPIHMKKGRPGFCIQIIAPPHLSLKLQQSILSETSAIGIRYRQENRLTLPRQCGTIQTPWGVLQVKKIEHPNGPTISPEYEDCRRIAMEQNISIREVYQETARYHIKDFRPENK